MQMLPVLKYTVIFSFLFAAVSLIILVMKTFSFGKKKLYAAPMGNVNKGILYAFGKGMLPREKESAKNHLPSYIAGILYHAGVFAAFFYLFVSIVSIRLPDPVLFFPRSLFLLGFISGAALLLKRIFSPPMKTLSCPDDFAANILVDIFVISALLHTFFPGTAPFFFLAAVIMFLYMPLGKIRHCFFFFYVRILYGIFYGRRDVFPPKKHVT